MAKYIDAEKIPFVTGNTPNEPLDYVRRYAIDNMPAADVVEVVRCRDCVMWDGSFTLNGQKKCLNMTFCTDGDFYCGWGSKE